ncbi:MAG TPA: hypothetical protein VG939_11575 [Caulobacteraceae bacterium]|nr:hypothetical protein [Caulobacteraceae bacterium]
MLFRITIAAAVLALAGAALADPAGESPTTQAPSTETATPAQSPPPPKPARDPIICEQSGPPTGSLLGGGKTCMHKSEWEARRRAARDQINDSVQRGGQMNCTPTFASGNGGC